MFWDLHQILVTMEMIQYSYILVTHTASKPGSCFFPLLKYTHKYQTKEKWKIIN